MNVRVGHYAIIALSISLVSLSIPSAFAEASVSTDKFAYQQDQLILISIFLDPEEFGPVNVIIQNDDTEIVYQTQFSNDRKDGRYTITTNAAFPAGNYKVIVESENQKAEWLKLKVLQAPFISVSINKTEYRLNELIKVSGEVLERIPGIYVTINVISPDGIILKSQSAEIQDDNTFSDSILVDEPIFGVFDKYGIRVLYDVLQSETSFELLEQVSKPEPQTESSPVPESEEEKPEDQTIAQSDANEMLSEIDELKAENIKLKLQNRDLKKEITELQQKIDDLNQIIMEQVKVIYEWVVGK